MSISEQIDRLSSAKEAIKTALENIGITVQDDALLSEYAPYVAQAADNAKSLISRTGSEYTIPTGVETIAPYAFLGYESLESVHIPSTVEQIGEYAFEGCVSLEDIEIPDSVEQIGEACFSYCDNILNAKIGSGLTHIPNDCFFACSNLNCVQLAEGVEEIGTGAFSNCGSLTEITLPKSVMNIDNNAFFDSGLSIITIKNNTNLVSLGDDAFGGTPIANGMGLIYVPQNMLTTYRLNSEWHTYASQIRAITTYGE